LSNLVAAVLANKFTIQRVNRNDTLGRQVGYFYGSGKLRYLVI
jgi:hypothetical protein